VVTADNMDRRSAPERMWQPYCGTEFGACTGGGQSVGAVALWPEIAGHVVAGFPVVCDLEPHSPAAGHHNTELGFSWISSRHDLSAHLAADDASSD
jgi:hypothetical protein